MGEIRQDYIISIEVVLHSTVSQKLLPGEPSRVITLLSIIKPALGWKDHVIYY